MIWQYVRIAMLAGGLLAAAGLPARANEEDTAPPAPGASAPADCTQYRTVCVREWVPETYQCTRTVYHRECKEVPCTTYKCECVPETRTFNCTTYKMVPETRTVVRRICECVPTVEQRTVMQTFVTCKPVTTTCRRCVDRGHYECREVPCGPSFRERFRRFWHRHYGCGDCCNDCCNNCCQRTKTIRCWVPCPVWEETPVTCYKRVCESRPVTCSVTVYKHQVREQTCQVTCCKCKPETVTKTCTVMVRKLVPCQSTRTVVTCVPHQETVTCCRMVCRTVQKQVPCAPCCETTCCAKNCCATTCCHSRHLFDRGCGCHTWNRGCHTCHYHGGWRHHENCCN